MFVGLKLTDRRIGPGAFHDKAPYTFQAKPKLSSESIHTVAFAYCNGENLTWCLVDSNANAQQPNWILIIFYT